MAEESINSTINGAMNRAPERPSEIVQAIPINSGVGFGTDNTNNININASPEHATLVEQEPRDTTNSTQVKSTPGHAAEEDEIQAQPQDREVEQERRGRAPERPSEIVQAIPINSGVGFGTNNTNNININSSPEHATLVEQEPRDTTNSTQVKSTPGHAAEEDEIQAQPQDREVEQERRGSVSDQSDNSKRQGGCMLCWEAVKVTKNGKLIPGELKAGDHIATRGKICCLGRFYDHHAIVTNVQTDSDNNTAVIKVVEVNRKGCECNRPACERCTCCCCGACWCCSCIHCQYPIENNQLYDETWGLTTGGSGANNKVITQTIKRHDYKSRRNDHDKSTAAALNFLKENTGLEYCVLKNNCESLASACVNARNDVDELKKSISQQARNCWWRLFHFLFYIVQGLFYFFNFSIYGVFVAKDDDFKWMNATWVNNLCHAPNNSCRGFDTHCDWYVLVIYIIVCLIIFTLSQIKFYQPLFNKGFICQQCLIIARLDCFSKILTFVIIEIVSIFLENPLYKAVTKRHLGYGTIPILMCVSAIGAILVFVVSSVLTWVLGMCGMPTCRKREEFTRYYHFRGL